MSGFANNIFGIRNLCDKYCKVLFTKKSVIIFDSNNQLLLKRWRETSGAKLCCISLRPDLRLDLANYLPCHEDPKADAQEEEEATLEAFSAYDFPSVEALVIYLHSAAGYPVRDTWLKEVKAGNYDSWPVLTYINTTRYCPLADDTIKGHMVHTRQGIQSTKPKKPRKQGVEELPEIDEPTPGNDSVN